MPTTALFLNEAITHRTRQRSMLLHCSPHTCDSIVSNTTKHSTRVGSTHLYPSLGKGHSKGYGLAGHLRTELCTPPYIYERIKSAIMNLCNLYAEDVPVNHCGGLGESQIFLGKRLAVSPVVLTKAPFPWITVSVSPVL